MYTYERVRARNFAKTWGFVQCSQAIPIAIGVPISGNEKKANDIYLNSERKHSITYYSIHRDHLSISFVSKIWIKIMFLRYLKTYY